MAPISLKIVLEGAAVTKTLLFDLNTTISQAHHIVRDKIHSLDPDKEYGFFLPSADNDCSGVWLEGYRTFEYYMLREGDSLFYLEKVRNVRLRMLDGSVKTIQVDESKCVGDLMVSICEKIGTTNYEEYGLCREHMETEEAKPMTGTLTLRKKTLAREKDAELQQLSKKLKTDDNVEWLDQHKTLRELLVDPKETLLFKRRLFYSDRKVDARDPVQLNLLYVQTRDAILDGRQIVTEQKAVEFAGLQCQIQYEDFIEDKHKPGFIENLREFLPAQYATSWGIEKKIFKEHKKHHGLSQLEAKQLYTKTARELPTYGVTFFLVKEKHKGKKKLIPRLLGINSESVLRLDEETKEILQVWPLTQVKSYRAASESFTLDFGDYSDKEYAVKTNEAFRIKDILQGYIDIIRKKTAPPYNVTYTEGEAMCEDTVEISRGTIIQNIVPSKIVEHSFVGPSRIISVEQGHNTSEGVRITTVHEMVTVNQGDKSQHGMKGEILGETPDMFGKRLNRINSLAVKAVMLSDEKNNLSGLQGIASNMENELPAVVKGVRERAKQLDDEHSKKLLDELDELCDYINNLSITVKSSDYDSPEKLLLTNETAKKLADISALMYLSLDPKTKKRSQLIKSSRNSFIADEKTEAHLRRLSLKSSIAATHQVLDNAYSELGQEYIGSAPGPQVIETIEKSINYKLGKLNAAVALLLNAHSDPQEVNYATAVTCMSTIKELIPELIQDVNTLNSFTEGDEERTALTSQVKLLLDRLAALCCLNGTDDPQKIQDAGKAYGDESRKLIYTFNRGVQRDRTVDKESEIMNLAKNVAESLSNLLSEISDLNSLVSDDPRSGELDDAGVKCADAAKELYACAQLTAPSINEPHCQSALTEACENLSSSVSHLTHTYKPIVDDPGRHYYGKRLNDRVADLNRELLRLKDAYINLSENNNGNDESYNLDDGDISAQRRLKFKALITRGKKALSEAENHLDPNSQSTSVNNGVQTQIDVESLQSLLNRKIGQLNSAVANLIKESISDEPDYEVYNRAISYISKLTPEIMRDAKILEDNVKELNGDNSTKHEVLDNLQTILNTVNDIAFGEKDVNKTDLYDAADNFVKSTHKLYWTFNPRHKTEEDNMLMDQAKDVGDKTSALLIDTSELISSIGSGPRAEELEGAGVRCADAAKAFIICAELTTPTIKNPYSQAVLESSVDNLESSIENLTDTYTPIVEEPERYYYGKTLAARNEALMKALEKLRCIYEKEKSAAVRFPNEDEKAISDEEKAQRLKFIASISRLNSALQDAEEKLLVGSPNTVIYNEADLQEIQNQSSNNLARLNAAIASLLKSLSGIPDYEKTNAAISAIAELTPEIIRDGKILENHVDGYEKEALIDNLEAMVEAAKDICTHSAAHNDTDLKNAAMKFAKSSGKLTYIFNPHANLEKESEIIDLTNDVALKTSLLLRNLRGITSINPPPPEELISNVDRAILTCNDAVNDLKNCAKLTAPCIEELNCQCALSAACENLAAKLEDLVLTFKPMLEEPSRQRSAKTIVQNTVDVSVALAKLKTAYPFSTQEDLSNKPTEAIKSVASLSPMKKALLDAEQFFDDKHNINQHLGRQSGKPDVKLSLTRSIAEMNATIATMLHATIEEPDYNFVETSMAKIANIIPSIVDDAAFMAYQNAEDTICQDIKPMFTSLINISKDVENDQLKGLNNSAMEFAKTSQKIYHDYSPQIDRRKEDQILDLSRGACRDASKLLTKVYQLAKELQDPVATELDNCGTGIVDTAQVFLTAAEVTAPSMMEPECQTAMVSLTDTFLSKIKNLENLWMPLTGTYQDLGDQLHKDSSILETTLNKMKEICVYNKDDETNKRREELVEKILDAKEKIKEAEMLMVEDKLAQLPEPPLLEVVAIMTEKGCVEKKSIEQTKRFLSDKLAELNQYISTLVQAASDREAINHSQQGELVGKISEVTPETLKCILSTHKYLDEDTSRAMVEEAKAVCGRTQDILTNIENENIEELNDAVSKYALSSGKLYYIFSPYKKAENAKEREVLQLVRSACERTSLMLSRVSRLAKMVDAKDAEPCDTIGVKLADAAQVLLSSAQLLAPSMRFDASRTVLSSSVNNVSDLATTLGNAWSLIIEQDELGEQLDKDLADLQSDLDKLKNILDENTQFAEETDNLQTENIDNFVTDDVAKTSDIDVKIEDTPLKELAMKILKSAKSDLESKTLSPEEHTALQTFTNELSAAICALDLATARCKSDLLDPKKRQHLENVVQNLQHICLVSRQNGDEQSYIIDLMEFVKHVTSAADDLYQTTAYVEQDRCKKALTKIRDGCDEIKTNADNLSNPQEADESVIDDMLLVAKFSQECDDGIKTIQSAVDSVNDEHSREVLIEKLRILMDKSDLLKFATKGSVSLTNAVAIEENLQKLTEAEEKIDMLLKCTEDDDQREREGEPVNIEMIKAAQSSLSSAVISKRDDILSQALTQYAIKMLSATPKDAENQLRLKKHLERLSSLLKKRYFARGRRVATWQDSDDDDVTDISNNILKEIDENILQESKAHLSLNENALKTLITPSDSLITGDLKELHSKLYQQIQKLSFMIGTVMLSCQKQESLSKSLHSTAEAVAETAGIAKAIKEKDIIQGKRIEEATKYLTSTTYDLLVTSESVSQDLHKPESRRKLLDACRALTEALNKFAQASSRADKATRDSEELQRNLQLHQMLLTADQPTCALGYADCLDALQTQGEVIHKLNSDEPMTRAECSTTLRYVTSAVCASAEYAAHSAYLLSLSEEDEHAAKIGFVDKPRLCNVIDNIDKVCTKITSSRHLDEVKAMEPILNQQLQILSEVVEDCANKIPEEDSNRIRENYKDVKTAAEDLKQEMNAHATYKEEAILPRSTKLLNALQTLKSSINRLPSPKIGKSQEMQQQATEIMDNAKSLLQDTSRLVNKLTSSEDEVLTWVMYGTESKRVIKAYEELLNIIKNKGKDRQLLQASGSTMEDQPPKSHLETQIDLINKWLRNPACKNDVKANAVQAAENIIDMGEKMCEDLKDVEKEEMQTVVVETKELLNECSVKYQSAKASLLLERIRELKAMIERGVVTRVVEEFLEEQPLEDFENIHKETDAKKREFLLDKKIAELLAQLARVSRTAQFVSDTSTTPIRQELLKTSNQVELLAPSLVKAAQDSVRTQDDQAIENYRKLVMEYAESLARVRELCDRAVDPIDFAQAAGETMARIKEDCKNDPKKSAYTSRVIIRLGNRVVEASLSNANVQKDPELQQTLAEIKKSITAASNTRTDLANEIIRKTEEVESALGGETIFQKEPETDQPILAAAHELHAAVRDWSARDNEVVAAAKRVAVLMAQLSHHMYNDRKNELIATAKAIVAKSHEVADLARKLAMECSDLRIRNNLLQVCQRIPLISGQLKMLTTVKGSTLGKQGTEEDQEAMNMLVGNAQNLMKSIQEVVNEAESASVKIMSQRGRRLRWKRRNYY